jgi:hypothetical protein
VVGLPGGWDDRRVDLGGERLEFPRAIISSSISRKLSGNRWYSHAQWLRISTG